MPPNKLAKRKAPVQVEPAQFLRREEPDRLVMAHVKVSAPKSWDRTPRFITATDTDKYDGWTVNLAEAAVLTFPQAVKFWLQAKAANYSAGAAFKYYEFLIVRA